jgi:hypothetical protein
MGNFLRSQRLVFVGKPILPVEENTAYYRLSARQAASECNWSLAAQQLTKAIEFYPDNGGALADLDISRMRETLANYERIASYQD